MKKSMPVIITITLCASIFLFSRCSTAVPPFINLAPSDYDTGMTIKNAEKTGKSIVMYFYVDWCHYCKKFAPSLEKIRQQYEAEYSFVFINCDDPENRSIIGNYGISGYPSLFLIDKDKKVKVSNSKMGNMKLLKQEFDGFLK